MSKYLAPALDKGLDIIEYLSMKAIPQSQVEISNGIDKSPNEIYRMLVRLEERGYLNKNASSGKYSLSLKLYQLSHRHSPFDSLVKTSKPIMEALSGETKQSCHMSILYNGQLMVVSQTRSPGPVSLSIEEGGIFPIVKTTSGRVFLAFMDEQERKSLLANNKEYKKLTGAQKKEFIERLSQIKERGYELETSEITVGVTDIAVPIGDVKTGVFSVLAISSLAKISDEQNTGELLVEKIKKAAEDINLAIGTEGGAFIQEL